MNDGRRGELMVNDLPDATSDSSAEGIAIDVDSVAKDFGTERSRVPALKNVDLKVRHGEFLVLVGPSGSGKTTLLRMIAGLEKPTSGAIRFHLEDSSRPLRSMVFQEQGVFPWMTALANAEFGLAVRGVPKRERRRIAMGFLERLHIGGFANSYPRQLSGGMRQRVNLARAFANDPSVLLMDEPFASLDEQMRMLVQVDLVNLWQGSGKVVIFVTHSLDEAVLLGDRVVVMTQRPGRVKAVIPVDIPRPRDMLELRSDPQFVEIRKQAWEALRSEVATGDGRD